MFFSELLAAVNTAADGVKVDIPVDWMQGRSVFGGLQVAIAVKAMRTLVPQMPLRTVQATFLAPLPAGQVIAHASVLRRGKNTVHVLAHLLSGDDIVCNITGVFGNARESRVAVVPLQQPVDAAHAISIPYIEGVTPAFSQYFRAVVAQGVLPFSGSQLSESVINLEMVDHGGTTESHLIAIADFMPPLAQFWFDSLVPGSSLTWMLQLLLDDVAALPLANWRVDARLVAACDGYTSQSVTVWAPGGIAAAIGNQSMVVFG